ncbi:NlpC/P60 family protein [Pseudomonas oryzihabitans]|uniref:Peptidase P60 n=1 Tax=Pseudomonas oryzihabitans TaxID=47885 RepID=A0A2Z5AA14_9PSED|nr:NlpC/P60 family protein [Pseudomonas oryzihabitans]AXA66756.1 peptidase P60 [Pseudomonas oryzihabitans]
MIVDIAKETLGTPFHHQGRALGVGMDCAGVLVHVLFRLGLPFNDEMGYPRSPYDGQLEKILEAQPAMRRIPVAEAGEGDVLLMRLKTAPQHIAIHAGFISGQPYVIHGSEQHGKVVHHRLDSLWNARVVRAYRLELPE